MPELSELVSQVIGTPYCEGGETPERGFDCWGLLRFIFREGRGIVLDADPFQNMARADEVWWRDEAMPVEGVMQPYDVLVFAFTDDVSSHVGLVVDLYHFLHTRRRVGTCQERLTRWQTKILQVVRVR